MICGHKFNDDIKITLLLGYLLHGMDKKSTRAGQYYGAQIPNKEKIGTQVKNTHTIHTPYNTVEQKSCNFGMLCIECKIKLRCTILYMRLITNNFTLSSHTKVLI